jgi:hypothetical protein
MKAAGSMPARAGIGGATTPVNKTTVTVKILRRNIAITLRHLAHQR